MIKKMVRWGTVSFCILLLLLAGFLIARVYGTQNKLPLELWHTFLPSEMRQIEIDKADWDGYLEAEDRIFDEIRHNVVSKTVDSGEHELNRYNSLSQVYPENFADNWNRSYSLHPDVPVKGAVVLLHGLTDSPYSLRHIADHYRQMGFVAVGIRLPAHGTLPSALTDIGWEDWLAATRLAVREATSRAGEHLPLHIVGFSNGGALAMKYTLDALEDPQLIMPQQVVLISPMIGITRFARYAGLAGIPAILPAFSRAAWLNIVPEFNPFKYNSFPVNAARQSFLLTQVLQKQIILASKQDKLQKLPPILTFQSLLDSTVSTRAVVQSLYDYLPDNGSELVIFDRNRTVHFRTLFSRSSDMALSRLLPPATRHYNTTLVTNDGLQNGPMIARTTLAGSELTQEQKLNLTYPADLFSLSHVALPFPVTDSLYGREPSPPNRYGISFGTLVLRGESSVLHVGMDTLMRVSSNPFFDYMVQRIKNDIRPLSPQN
jgi:alpha-beta hydrolase superfamily lysophospholipase